MPRALITLATCSSCRPSEVAGKVVLRLPPCSFRAKSSVLSIDMLSSSVCALAKTLSERIAVMFRICVRRFGYAVNFSTPWPFELRMVGGSAPLHSSITLLPAIE